MPGFCHRTDIVLESGCTSAVSRLISYDIDERTILFVLSMISLRWRGDICIGAPSFMCASDKMLRRGFPSVTCVNALSPKIEKSISVTCPAMACPTLIRISHGGHCVPPNDPCAPKYPARPVTFVFPVDGPEDNPK